MALFGPFRFDVCGNGIRFMGRLRVTASDRFADVISGLREGLWKMRTVDGFDGKLDWFFARDG